MTLNAFAVDDGASTEPVAFGVAHLSSSGACHVALDGTAQCSDGEVAAFNAVKFKTVEGTAASGCGLTVDGEATCWGMQGNGTHPPPHAKFVKVAFYSNKSACGLTDENRLECWGYGDKILEMPDTTYIYLSTSSICAVTSNNKAFCDYYSEYDAILPDEELISFDGKDGDTTGCGIRTDNSIVCNSEEVTPPSGSFMALQVTGNRGSLFHGCAIDGEGELQCWGGSNSGNTRGELDVPAGVFTQLAVARTSVVANAVFESSNCALREDGAVLCWGEKPTRSNSLTELSVAAVQLSQPFLNQCGITEEGRAWCWGSNKFGQLNIPANMRFREISAGVSHVCGIDTDNHLVCWGDDAWGQSSPPAGKFQQVSAGVEHSCALTMEGQVQCWGSNDSGESTPPPGVFSHLSTGLSNACAIREDGEAVCWGDDLFGKGSPVSGTFTRVATTSTSTCAVTTEDVVRCWGFLRGYIPDAKFVDVQSRYGVMTGIDENGEAQSWTDTGRQLFDTPESGKPDASYGSHRRQDIFESGIFAISDEFYVGNLVDAEPIFLRCKTNSRNELICNFGEPPTERAPYLDLVVEPESILFANEPWGCALNDEGQVTCWGVGDGVGEPPDEIQGQVVQLTASGSGAVCSLLSNGSAICWGPNSKKLNKAAAMFERDGFSFQQISATRDTLCGISVNGAAACEGKLKFNTQELPERYTQIEADRFYLDTPQASACAVSESGTVTCWSRNANSASKLNELLSETQDVTSVSLGRDGVAVLRASGSVLKVLLYRYQMYTIEGDGPWLELIEGPDSNGEVVLRGRDGQLYFED